jgi:membrane protein
MVCLVPTMTGSGSASPDNRGREVYDALDGPIAVGDDVFGYPAAMTNASTARHPGATAEAPQQIPARGWFSVIKRAWADAKADQVPLLAAGVAFFSFLSLFPAMIAAVMVYGLVADPRTVATQAEQLAEALPQDAASLISEQMRAITQTPQQSLGLGLAIALALALWSASGGVGNVVTAINITYDEEETRGFVKLKAIALALTFGAIVFAVVAVTLIAVTPPLLDELVPSATIRVLLEVTRWVALVLAVMVALAVLYRIAPDRDAPRMRWVSVGAVVATVIWLLASLGFSLYVDNFGSYGKTYGALAGVAILMLWLWITAFVVLLGAEINAEAEHQTIRDSTVGSPEPLGRRGAVKADTVPEDDRRDRRTRRRSRR